jgi:N-acetylmuramoyl-L-alanine amidase
MEMISFRRISFCVFILFFAASFSSKIRPFGVRTIVIDAGHGGKDPGCHGKKHLEKDIALAVALKLGSYIQENLKDVKVVYTRTTDVFVELQERADIANRAKADLFISIHCNSACVRDKKLKRDICREGTNGAETFVMGIKNEEGNLNVAKRENSAILMEDNYVQRYEGFDPNSDESYIIMSMFTDTYLDRSLSFATKIQKQYGQKVGRTDRGVKRASLWVLWRTSMPSVLTEIGYLTNPEEELFLGSEQGQEYVASGLFRAFREYKDDLEGVIKKYNDSFENQESYKKGKEDSIKIPIEKESPKPDSASEKYKTLDKKEVKIIPDSSSSKAPYKELSNSISSVNKIKVPLQKDSVKASLANKNAITNQKAVYRVQILSSDKKLNLNMAPLNKLEAPWEYLDNNTYKYTSGAFSDMTAASKHQNFLKKNGFKDAFVILTRGDKRIPLK